MKGCLFVFVGGGGGSYKSDFSTTWTFSRNLDLSTIREVHNVLFCSCYRQGYDYQRCILDMQCSI